MKTMKASDFKARCLAVLDEVEATGEVITILKRGRPVAQVVPPMYAENSYPQRALKGSVNARPSLLVRG
jgi:prevent-host-death family protein